MPSLFYLLWYSVCTVHAEGGAGTYLFWGNRAQHSGVANTRLEKRKNTQSERSYAL